MWWASTATASRRRWRRLGPPSPGSRPFCSKRYAHEIVLAYDADAAGRAATLRGLDILAGEGLECGWPSCRRATIRIRAGQEGLEAFRHLIDTSVPLVEYKMNEAIRGFDRGRSKAGPKRPNALASARLDRKPCGARGLRQPDGGPARRECEPCLRRSLDFLAKGSGERRIRSRQSVSRHKLSSGTLY